jgi:hypothetical protein
MNNEDNIRPPDKVITERLVDINIQYNKKYNKKHNKKHNKKNNKVDNKEDNNEDNKDKYINEYSNNEYSNNEYSNNEYSNNEYSNNDYKEEYDEQLKLILELSKNEYISSQEIEEQKEIDTIIQNSNVELDKYNSIKNKLNKILCFDKQNKEIYELILSIIQLYETGYITTYQSTRKEYNNIFVLLKTIRLTNEEEKSLKSLITEE